MLTVYSLKNGPTTQLCMNPRILGLSYVHDYFEQENKGRSFFFDLGKLHSSKFFFNKLWQFKKIE